MAVNTVHVVGDQSNIVLHVSNITAVDVPEFLSGSFRGSPEERRIMSIFLSLESGTKTIELRFEFTDPLFVQQNIVGKSVYPNSPDTLQAA